MLKIFDFTSLYTVAIVISIAGVFGGLGFIISEYISINVQLLILLIIASLGLKVSNPLTADIYYKIIIVVSVIIMIGNLLYQYLN